VQGGVAVLVAVLGLTGCAGGSNAVAQSGNFDFVSPGGKTEIFYDPPASRGTIGTLSGPDLLTAATTTAVSDFTGQVVVINLWGSWCAPCRAEAPELESTYTSTKALGVQFVGIDVRDERQAAQDFIADRTITYPSIFDPSMRSLLALGGKYPTSVIPSTLVLDRRHRVAAVFLRAIVVADLQPIVERVAAQT